MPQQPAPAFGARVKRRLLVYIDDIIRIYIYILIYSNILNIIQYNIYIILNIIYIYILYNIYKYIEKRGMVK